MNNESKFVPEEVLRKLEYHKKLAKTNPPETLFWHSINVHLCARELADLESVPFSTQDRKIILWSSLFHDSGKSADAWQERGRGPHPPGEETEEKLRGVMSGYADDPEMSLSDDEKETVFEFIREHHTRNTLSTYSFERIMKIIKLADRIVSATLIDGTVLGEVERFVQPNYKPVVLTAEDHPISYRSLSYADDAAEKCGAKLLLANRLQSMYLVPEGADIVKFKEGVGNDVDQMIAEKIGGSMTPVLSNIYSGKYMPIRDRDSEKFLVKLYSNRESVYSEIEDELKKKEGIIERLKKKGKSVDEDTVWYGPFRVLVQATGLLLPKSKHLLGTEIEMKSLKEKGKHALRKEMAREVANVLGVHTPREYINRVLDVIIQSVPKPEYKPPVHMDVFHWSDSLVDATSEAEKRYLYYRENMWNSRNKKREIENYCFSCKTRPPTKEAPLSNYLPTDTWTSSGVGKEKVMVCELCYIAKKYFLPDMEWGKFHADCTPAYNHVRLDWVKNVFWPGANASEEYPSYVNSHTVTFPLDAKTPNGALAEVFGYTEKYKMGTEKEYPSIVDFFCKIGLNGTVGAGPKNPRPEMLAGVGVRIGFSEWEDYGEVMRMLRGMNAKKEDAKKESAKETFSVGYVWRRLVSGGWGVLLASRCRDKATMKMISHKENVETIKRLMEVKRHGSDGKMIDEVRNLPVWEGDRDEWFSSAERVIRQMERVTLSAAKHPETYGNERDIEEVIAGVGMKRLRSEIIKASGDKIWRITDKDLSNATASLNWIAGKLWSLRNSHGTRSDFVNAVIVAMTYSNVKGVD